MLNFRRPSPSVGWHRQDFPQWLCLPSLRILIHPPGFLHVCSSCRHHGELLEDSPRDLHTPVKPAPVHVSHFHVFYLLKEVVWVGLPLKNHTFKVPHSHIQQLSLVCGWTEAGSRSAWSQPLQVCSIGQEASGCLAVQRQLKPSVWTMCAAVLDKYCGSVFWVSPTGNSSMRWDHCGLQPHDEPLWWFLSKLIQTLN